MHLRRNTTVARKRTKISVADIAFLVWKEFEKLKFRRRCTKNIQVAVTLINIYVRPFHLRRHTTVARKRTKISLANMAVLV